MPALRYQKIKIKKIEHRAVRARVAMAASKARTQELDALSPSRAAAHSLETVYHFYRGGATIANCNFRELGVKFPPIKSSRSESSERIFDTT